MSENRQTGSNDQAARNWFTRLWEYIKSRTWGDVIITNVGEGSHGVAVGKNIIQIGTIVLPTIHVIVLIVLLAVTLLIAFILPRPPRKMTGEFNIAIAEFQTSGEAANNSFDIAQVFYQRLKGESEKLGTDVNTVFDIMDPVQAGLIAGRLREARAVQAEDLAERINADLIVYGIVESNGATILVTPEFFVSTKSFYEAEEIVGQYRLGASIKVDNSLDSPLKKKQLNEALSARSSALSLLSIGLSYYVKDDYENALYYFNKANQVKGWDEGREVMLVLSGYSALKRESLEQALNACREALRINPAYSRAYICLGDVLYRQAVGQVNTESYEHVNFQLLDEAVRTFLKATQVEDQPPGAYISTKVHLALGEAYLLKAAAIQGDLIPAIIEFQAVIADYESGSVPNERIRELASHAFAHLGLAYRLSDNPQNALSMYEKAVALTRTNERKAFYAVQLGETYTVLHDTKSAIYWYTQAVNFSKEGSETRRKYEQRLDILRATSNSTLNPDVTPSGTLEGGLIYEAIQITIGCVRFGDFADCGLP